MDIQSILHILSGNSKDLKILQKNVGYVRDFINLIEKLNSLPQIKSRVQEEGRNFYSLYKAVGEGVSHQSVEKHLIGFFGAPVKRFGEAPSFKLKFFQSIKLMGKILPEQAFYVRKLKKAEFFAAIWPWVRKPGYVTIHMGFYSKTLSDKDFEKLEDVVRTSTHEKITKEMGSDIGGQIRGINLPTFLQMAEQERNTCSLSITNKEKSGRLYLENGELIDGETDTLKGKDAVYEIIKWDNVIIEIEKYSLKRKNVINTPVLNILLEGLKQKDEEQAQNLEAQAEADQTGVNKIQPSEPQLPKERLAKDVQDYQGLFAQKTNNELIFYDDLEKKPVLKYVFVTILVCALLGAGVWGSQYWLKTRDIKANYDAAIKAVELTSTLDQKENILNEFISSHALSIYTESAKKKLVEIRSLRDDAVYEDILHQLKQLPLTHDFDDKAKTIYESYLKRFPSGKNAATVKQQIEKLPEMVEEAQYNHLLTNPWESKEKKIEAYKKHLYYHPKGKHREEAELFLVLEIEERYEEIKRQTDICEKQEQWSDCLALCNQFLKLFDKTYRTDEIRKIKDAIEVKQNLAQLSQLAQKLEPDHWAIKRIYSEYLAQNPNFLGKDTLQKEIDKRQKLIDQNQSWKAVMAYVEDRSKSFIEKIQALDAFIDKDPSGPYAGEARQIREKVRQERLEHDHKNRLEGERRQQEARLRAEFLQKQRQTNRLNQEIIAIQKKLYDLQNIYEYHNDGTFTDKRTGLTWCILDSSIVLGKCLNYDEAVQYVASLDTGGKTNWRLPTFSELAGLYKNEPFFPADGPKWFWTIERVVKGYHEMVGIVTSEKENVFTRDFFSTKECGTVHAVLY